MYLAQALYYIPVFPNCFLFPGIQPICLFQEQSNFLPFDHWEEDAIATTMHWVPTQNLRECNLSAFRYPHYNATRWTFAKRTCIAATWNQERVVERVPNYMGLTSPFYRGGLAYVLDTWIDISHRDFGGRAYRGPAFATGNVSGHGTHVAGLIISNTFGMARNAVVIGVQVMNGDGIGDYSNVLRGLSWAAQDWESRGKPHAVINLSIGGPYSYLLNTAVEAIRKNGLHVVVAAGNSNTDACKTSPASANVITVGATDKNDRFASFSNHGSCVSILAPGVDIHSLYPNQLEAIMSGTSMAAPIVSAILLNYTPQTPTQMHASLIYTASLLMNIPNGTTALLIFHFPTMICPSFTIQN
jgi:cerevisin